MSATASSDATTDRSVTLSENAAKRINAVLATEAPGAMLRVGVSGGGCSGFQYVFEIDACRQTDDIVVERAGARVLIDTTSLDYLAGSTIDFVDDLMGQAFRITNPQATASCGCGTSFAL